MDALLTITLAVTIGLITVLLKVFKGRKSSVREQIERDIELRKKLTSDPEDKVARDALTRSIERGVGRLATENPDWLERDVPLWTGPVGFGLLFVGLTLSSRFEDTNLSSTAKAFVDLIGYALGVGGATIMTFLGMRLRAETAPSREIKRQEKRAAKQTKKQA